jgi:hypothetical protein
LQKQDADKITVITGGKANDFEWGKIKDGN